MCRFFCLLLVIITIVVVVVVGVIVGEKGGNVVKVSPKSGNCFLSSEPHSHLVDVLFLVARSVRLLCIVDVQPFQ